MRHKKSRSGSEPGEVSLIPIMNLVCLLIPFLLYTASFVVFASVSASMPRITPEAPRDREQPPDPSIALTITDEGFHVRAPDGELPAACSGAAEDRPSFPLRPDAASCSDASGYPTSQDRSDRVARRVGPPVCAYDFRGLHQCVMELKQENPETDRIVILGEAGVGYDVLIQTMDVARGDETAPLFPEVVLGTGLG